MRTKVREHLAKWPGPKASRDEIIAWLDGYPSARSMEGPHRQYALRQGGKWLVDAYEGGPMCGPTRIGTMDSAALYDHWDKTGLGWMCCRPSITTDEFHGLLTGTLETY